MKLIELTDFFGTGTKEYLNPDLIARIEAYTQEDVQWETVKRTTSGFLGLFSKTVDDKLFKGTDVKNGSLVYMKNKGQTYVKETPQEIIEIIKNKQFVVES